MDKDQADVRGIVATDRPERYGKQLVAHLGRRNGGQWSTETRSGWIDLGTGRAEIIAHDGQLHLHISAAADELARLQGVVGDHLIRFGERDELMIAWTVGDPAPTT